MRSIVKVYAVANNNALITKWSDVCVDDAGRLIKFELATVLPKLLFVQFMTRTIRSASDEEISIAVANAILDAFDLGKTNVNASPFPLDSMDPTTVPHMLLSQGLQSLTDAFDAVCVSLHARLVAHIVDVTTMLTGSLKVEDAVVLEVEGILQYQPTHT